MNTIKLQIHFDVSEPSSLATAIQSANDGIGKGDERWRTLWQEPTQGEHLREISSIVASLKPYKNVLVLGIGGSALGTKALYNALGGDESVNMIVLDNIDPHTFKTSMQQLSNDSKTVVVAISKSGGTAEIGALLMATQRALPNASYVAVTGETGELREYAIANKWPTLPVPDGVGGRFSVLSPVGLFPLALCGIAIQPLLDGAREMDELCQATENNPAGNLACALISAMHDGHNIQVMMPYCDRLVKLADWYVQLWAESLGKIDTSGTRVGPSPMTALGATDQHSMLQLWREGPTDKVIGFISTQETEDVSLGDEPLTESLSWLCGTSMASLLNAQRNATEQAVREAGQKTWAIQLPNVSPHSLGQFIALWQISVAIAGRMLHVNPYDQTGVELGKMLTKKAYTH